MYARVHSFAWLCLDPVLDKKRSIFIVPCPREWPLRQLKNLFLKDALKLTVDFDDLSRVEMQQPDACKVGDRCKKSLWYEFESFSFISCRSELTDQFISQMHRILETISNGMDENVQIFMIKK